MTTKAEIKTAIIIAFSEWLGHYLQAHGLAEPPKGRQELLFECYSKGFIAGSNFASEEMLKTKLHTERLNNGTTRL
jgi:hypothetical protein